MLRNRKNLNIIMTVLAVVMILSLVVLALGPSFLNK
jgi:hypothetical protein